VMEGCDDNSESMAEKDERGGSDLDFSTLLKSIAFPGP